MVHIHILCVNFSIFLWASSHHSFKVENWKIGTHVVKFLYSEKATKFCEIFTLLLTAVKSKVKIAQNILAFSEYMNFSMDGNEFLWKLRFPAKNITCVNICNTLCSVLQRSIHQGRWKQGCCVRIMSYLTSRLVSF